MYIDPCYNACFDFYFVYIFMIWLFPPWPAQKLYLYVDQNIRTYISYGIQGEYSGVPL